MLLMLCATISANQLTGIIMKEKIKAPYKPNNHAKMYAPDSVLKSMKEAATKEGLSQTSFMLLAVKAKIKQVNK